MTRKIGVHRFKSISERNRFLVKHFPKMKPGDQELDPGRFLTPTHIITLYADGLKVRVDRRGRNTV